MNHLQNVSMMLMRRTLCSVCCAALLMAPATTRTVVAQNDQHVAPGRRDVGDEEVPALVFEDISIKDTFPRLMELTGKVIMPVNVLTLGNKKFTLLTDRPMPRSKALDMIFRSFRLNGVGVIERDDVLIIGLIDDLTQLKQHPVIGADEDLSERQDLGSLVVKIFRLEKVPAEDVEDLISSNLPSYASMNVDANSNQIVVYGDIALCQHLETIIKELDHLYIQPKNQTFRLAHADAQAVADNIVDLFEVSGTTGGSTRPASSRSSSSSRSGAQSRGGTTQQSRTTNAPVGPEIELRVTVNTSQNSVTVSAEPTVVDEIARLIIDEWDIPRSFDTSKIYQLQYTDVLQVAEKLNNLLGQSSGGSSGGGSARAGAAQGGSSGSVEQILSGIYRIEPFPDTGQLLVFSKTEESLDFLDNVIEQLDQPTTIGIPFIKELKHANAVELAEQLNALLAEAGAGATIEAPETGLTGASLDEAGTGSAGTQDGTAGTISFPWQRGGGQNAEQSPETPLIGKVRIVPIVRQNALAILCPLPHRSAIGQLIDLFDMPGKQVEISVVIVEVDLTENLALGLRMSSADIGLDNAENAFGLGIDAEGTSGTSLFGLFDTGTLDGGIEINTVIQALQQYTNVKVMQNPVIFTSDNQEAYFFDGEEFPYTDQITTGGVSGEVQSIEYKDVGLILNARPRITDSLEINMDIRLELSKRGAQQSNLGVSIDRRQTSTNIVVRNGQTIVLSGLFKESEESTERKVPLLGDIPLIGELFTSFENKISTKEIIAFVTPRVVENTEDNDHNFQADYLEYLKNRLSRPLNEQMEYRQRNRDEFRQRFLPNENSGSSSSGLPDVLRN